MAGAAYRNSEINRQYKNLREQAEGIGKDYEETTKGILGEHSSLLSLGTGTEKLAHVFAVGISERLKSNPHIDFSVFDALRE